MHLRDTPSRRKEPPYRAKFSRGSTLYYLMSHIRIVAAFVLREIDTRYGKNPGGYIWAFLEPVAFIAMMATLIGAVSHIPPLGESFVLFYSTGYMAFSLFKTMESYLDSAVSANRSLLSYPVVAPIDAVFGRLILQGATSAIVTLIVISGALHFERHSPSINWISILEAFMFAWTLALGVSLRMSCCSSIFRYTKKYTRSRAGSYFSCRAFSTYLQRCRIHFVRSFWTILSPTSLCFSGRGSMETPARPDLTSRS